MLDEFVEVMYAYYESGLDMEINTLPGSMIEHRIFKPGTSFQEFLSVYIYVSNQTKGFYIDHTSYGETNSKINTYDVPQLITKWESIL